MNQFSFERLNAYQEARELTVRVYKLTDSFPKVEQFGLISQLRRAILSVPSNIAEGTGRISFKEKIHFNEIAYGSLMESYCQLQIAVDLGYLAWSQFDELKLHIHKVAALISGLSKSYKNCVK